MDGLVSALVGIAGFIVAIGAAFFGGRKAGRKGAQADAMQDTLDRVDRGRDAVRDGRGDNPADRLRRNGAEW